MGRRVVAALGARCLISTSRYCNGNVMRSRALNAKRSRIVTYRDRTRLQSAFTAVPVLFFLILGVYLGFAQGNWWILLIAVLVGICAAVVLWDSERIHRDNP